MWPDPVLNPGPLTYESGALSTALRSQTDPFEKKKVGKIKMAELLPLK